MTPTLVVDVVGLSQELLGRDTPNLNQLAERGVVRPLATVVPAVTCSAQATFLTGRPPREHGIVGNGWYFRELAEVWFWRQSNRLIEAKQVWELGRERDPERQRSGVFGAEDAADGRRSGHTGDGTPGVRHLPRTRQPTPARYSRTARGLRRTCRVAVGASS